MHTVPEAESLLCSEEMADLRTGAGSFVGGVLERAAVRSRIVEPEAGVLQGLGFQPNEAPPEGGQRAAEPVLDRLRALVAERVLINTQREMEALLQDIEKIMMRIARETSSSKQRSKCRNKKRSLEAQMKKVAGKYNKIIAALGEDEPSARQPVDVERLLRHVTKKTTSGQRRTGEDPEAAREGEQQEEEQERKGEAERKREWEPWCFEGIGEPAVREEGARRSFRNKLAVFHAHNRFQRIVEEKSLLVQEMQSFHKFYERVILNIDALIGELEYKVDNMATEDFVLSMAQLLHSGRYSLVQSDADVCIPYIMGLIAFLRARRSYYVALLARAGVCFRNCSSARDPKHTVVPPEVEDPQEYVV